jgi:hypothetical protein
LRGQTEFTGSGLHEIGFAKMNIGVFPERYGDEYPSDDRNSCFHFGEKPMAVQNGLEMVVGGPGGSDFSEITPKWY